MLWLTSGSSKDRFKNNPAAGKFEGLYSYNGKEDKVLQP
jgi:hypothetical protein